VIKSPVEGEIVDKRVQIGQTVVSSLNAPSLFLIAKDMSRMQVWASVNEADIGRIRPNMPVRFSVDAFPNEEFKGKVILIRNNATSTQNVVTYTVIVETDNSSKRLRPYLTTNLKFEIDERNDVLTVPNAALRFKPKIEQVALEYRDALANEKKSKKPNDSPGSPSGKDKEGATGGGDRSAKGGKKDEAKHLWVKEGELLKPIDVQTGVSDGVVTEVTGTAITEGLDVVLGELRKDQAGDETTNPFAPKMFGGPKKTK
jgi:HlyD family secretion protein